MESFSTEEQQVEAIKRFWKENGTAIILGAVIGLGGLWGWRYYTETQIAQREQASTQYEQLVSALGADEKGFSAAADYIKNNPENSYAMMTALQLAKSAVDSKDFAEAQKQLSWAAEHADDNAIKSLVQLRLARIQLAQEKADDAIKTLSGINMDAYSASVEEIKGDAYSQLGQYEQARQAYVASLDKNANNPLLQLKLDNLAALESK